MLTLVISGVWGYGWFGIPSLFFSLFYKFSPMPKYYFYNLKEKQWVILESKNVI